MTEKLLHFIWQFQYFNNIDLVTIAGEELLIVNPGMYNTNQGPDFSNARIKIDEKVWIGTVELHLATSDWNRHGHEDDKNYTNVILHVVWENDLAFSHVPVLELKGRVSIILLQRYEDLMNATAFIPCQKNISRIPELTWTSWKGRLLIERLSRKAGTITKCLQQNRNHWEETFWWLLARNFGMKVNADAFEAIAQSLPLTLLAKHKQNIIQLEALLLGQGGLLEQNFNDHYPKLLQREYRFLKRKYKLKQLPIPLYFLRMRPGNFPTIRLAQLAMLIHEADHMFSKIREITNAKTVRNWFDITANDFWQYHYRFSDSSRFIKKRIGGAMIDNIMTNTVIPLLFTYGTYYNEHSIRYKALRWLEETGWEENTITRNFKAIGIKCSSSYDSQALTELKNEYCDKKRCLECSIGAWLLKNSCQV
jgi:hypothetical protein